MPQKTDEPEKALAKVVTELGRYPMEAFEFLQEGLEYTVRKIHGPPEPGLRKVVEWLEKHGADLDDLPDLVFQRKIPNAVQNFLAGCDGVEGAVERLNRHVTAAELCWGLRDLAWAKWGLLASLVLRHWEIRSTKDFGLMVFALVDHRLLQKRPEDTLTDFYDVYTFGQAFDRSYRISPAFDTKVDSKAE